MARQKQGIYDHDTLNSELSPIQGHGVRIIDRDGVEFDARLTEEGYIEISYHDRSWKRRFSVLPRAANSIELRGMK